MTVHPRAVVWTAALAAALQTLIGTANEFTVESELLNPDEEGSIFQILSAIVTATAAAACAVRAIRSPARRNRFAALAAILFYFAADDALVIHERVGEAVGESLFGLPGYIAVRVWILVLAPLLVTVFLLVAAEAQRAEPRLRRVLLAGLCVLVAAVVVETGGAVTRNPSFIESAGGKPETMRYLLEEALELSGWVLLAGGLLMLIPPSVGRAREPRHAQSG